MSSILQKLKQADEEHQKSGVETSPASSASPASAAASATTPPATATPAAATPPVTAVPAPTLTPVAPAAATPSPIARAPAPVAPPVMATPPAASPSITAPAPAAPASAPIPAPAVASGGGLGVVKKAEVTPTADALVASGTPFAPVDFDDISDGAPAEGGVRKGLIEASRVFRASGDEGEGSTIGRTILYSVLAVFLVFGSGYAIVLLEIIPGVSPTSVLSLFGVREEVALQRQAAVPVLAVASSEDQTVSLPLPKIDVQAEVDFANLQADESDLLTEEGRREYAEKIAVIAGIVTAKELGREEDFLLPGLFDVSGGDGAEGEEAVEETYENIEIVKTANISRQQKLRINARTPSDRSLLSKIKIHRSGVVVVAEDGDDAGVVATEVDANTAPADADSTDETTANEEQDEEAVKPSVSGKERTRNLLAAAALYARGSYAAAEASYRAVLQKHPKNLSALRGLAIAAVATERYQLAVANYLEILKYYPTDAVALADLANLRGTSPQDFYKMESALRSAIGSKTPSADSRLYFALGNLYAGQNRWAEAQEAYFDAHTKAANNPDYAYNLAVVLDYLNKPAQATVYYQHAVGLARNAPAGFDAAAVSERIIQLTN